MDVFLRIKHWQLFLILIGVPFATAIYGNIQMAAHQNPRVMLYLFPYMMLIFIGTLIGWLWTLGSNLYKRLPENVSMKINKFKAFMIIPSIYMVSICLFIVSLTSGFRLQSASPLVLLIIPIHLFSIFCMFYSLYFVSKTLKAVELQREVKFEDYAGEFFLIWFFFIGVWFIQPG